METIKSKVFEQSTRFDPPDEDSIALEARRLSTYSVDALRAAKEVDRAFVLFPGVSRTLKALDRLFQLGTEFRMPQGMCLIGPSGVGKSATFEYFQASLPTSALFSQDFAALAIRVQSRPKTGQLIHGMLNAIHYPFSAGSNKQLYMRRYLLFDALKSYKTRLIWLDEAHHLIFQNRSTTKEWESESTEFLRELMDECKISLVLAGTSELDNLKNVADHLASRVTIREEMTNFSADVNWLGFVRAFVKQCRSFDLSYINDTDVGMRLHLASNGNLRSTKRLITEAVLISFDSGNMSLNRESFSLGFQRVFGESTMRSNPFV